MSDASAYEKWFWSEHSKIVPLFEPGVQQLGPSLPKLSLGIKSWRVEWYILFPDNFYSRLCENWSPTKTPGTAQRNHFSFHYGETPALKDYRGAPRWNATEPVTIRIDKDAKSGVHMHYAGKDHIPEAQVTGCNIRDIPLFEFLRTVLEHRGSQQTFDSLLGFHI